MELIDQSCRDFLEQLASKRPVPGGGGASALVGALGIALGCMVGELTVGKPKYAAVEEEMRVLLDRAHALRKELTACVEADAVAFEPLSRAYSLPKDTPGYAETMEAALREAASVPCRILDLSCEAIELQIEFARKGSALSKSDAATGAACCWGAICGAALNVKVNTKEMKDRAYAEEINEHVDAQLTKYRAIAERIYDMLYYRLD